MTPFEGRINACRTSIDCGFAMLRSSKPDRISQAREFVIMATERLRQAETELAEEAANQIPQAVEAQRAAVRHTRRLTLLRQRVLAIRRRADD